MRLNKEEILGIGKRMVELERRALEQLEQTLDDNFVAAVEAIATSKGRIIVTGMGKSGHIARKIASTLSSIGTPAIYLHPAEAEHGDMGVITKDDILLALSYSGETSEVINVVHFVNKLGNIIIAITGNNKSQLANTATIHLNIGVEHEDCVLNIVPTCSTTAQLAMGDAIATALIHIKGFNASDFAYLHPGGYMDRRIKMLNHNHNLE